jgi:acetyl-CoA carboxylase biotin carboxylase subunit
MFKKILIAARGEIALRVIRACKELGIKTVAVHSEADRESFHVKLADEDVCIGSAQPSDSYLNIPRIIAAAEITGSDAVHPGYGFLAENARFAEICKSCDITWIGPEPEVMEQMGDKALARALMAEAGLPTIPGSDGVVEHEEEAIAIGEKLGYPIMLKAAAGGGGRGIRIVENGGQLGDFFRSAAQEAEHSFGHGGLYLERYLASPRHVEVQVFGDGQGNVVHLG